MVFRAKFLGPVQISGGCTACELVTVGVNASDRTMQPGDVAAGERLTVAGEGMVRPLGSIAVQLAGDAGIVALAENAPVVGLALGAARSGLVWVLVNPQ